MGAVFALVWLLLGTATIFVSIILGPATAKAVAPYVAMCFICSTIWQAQR